MLKKKTSKIIAATSMVIFSLFTCFTGVYAWFNVATHQELENTGAQVVVDSNAIDFSYRLYKYNSDKKQGEATDGSSTLDLNLNKFDNLIRSRNINNNNILRFDVRFAIHNEEDAGKNRNLNLNINCEHTTEGQAFDSGVTDSSTRRCIDTNGFKYSKTSGGVTKDYVCNNMSNIIYFKAFPYSYTIGNVVTKCDSTLFTEGSDDEIYTRATEKFQSVNPVSFVNNDGSKKTSIINLNLNNYNIPKNASNFVFYLEYSYNQTLVDNVFLENNEFGLKKNTSAGNIPEVSFAKDITSLVINVGDAQWKRFLKSAYFQCARL